MGITDAQWAARAQELIGAAAAAVDEVCRRMLHNQPVISIYDERFSRQPCPKTIEHDDHLWWSNGTALLCAGPGA